MKKNFRKTLVAAAMVGAMASGVSSTASAFVYAMSHLNVQNFVFAANPATQVTVDSFIFSLTNTATRLGSPSVINTDACGGTVAFNSCGGARPGGAGVLNPLAAEIPLGARGGQDNYAFVGTGSTYSSSDSVIRTAELVTGTPSSAEQIAETNLLVNGQETGNAELQSTTNITFNLTVANSGAIDLDFMADADLRAAISEALAGAYSAQANVNTTFRLTRTSAGGGFFSWTPNGVLNAADCVGVIGIATCTETADGGGAAQGSLNQTISTGLNPSDILYSYDAGNVFNPYGIDIRALPSGTYSLSLNSVTSTNVFRLQAVPEPVSLALVAVGLLGMGVGMRRRNRNA